MTEQRKPRILIVEDELIVAMDLEWSLQALGYEVAGVAATGEDAINLARETQPNLALMDIRIQGRMDGVATAREIRRLWQIPVIFVSAFASKETLARAEGVGAAAYLTKPFRARELEATVAQALARQQSGDQG